MVVLRVYTDVHPALTIAGHSSIPRIMNKRFYLFCAATWAAAAILIIGDGAMSTDVLSGVVALAGFDLLRP